MRYRLSVILCLGLLLGATSVSAKKKPATARMLLSTAMQEEKVSLEARSTAAGYHAKGVSLSVRNLTEDNLILELDAGILLQPVDTQYQNLIVQGQELLAVNAGKMRTLAVQTYCGESRDRAPVAELEYRFMGIGDRTMAQLLRFIRTKQVPADMAQHAVWVCTDKHGLNDVYDPEHPELSKSLVQYMSTLLGLEMPAYYTLRGLNTVPGQLVQPPAPLKLVAQIQWDLPAPAQLSLQIYNAQNERVASYFEHKAFAKGHYDLHASFETADYPSGHYTIRLLKADQTVLKEIEVLLQ